MSIARSCEPAFATVAAYTLTVLTQVKRRGVLFPQEWEYLKNAPYQNLQELLAYAGFGFTPVVLMGDCPVQKETSEMHWQFYRAYAALKVMGVVSETANADGNQRRIVKALALYRFILLKTAKKRCYPEAEEFQIIFEQYRQFLFHLYGAVMGFQTLEVRRLMAVA